MAKPTKAASAAATQGPKHGPMNGRGGIRDTKHATNKYANGRPAYTKPYGAKKK